MPVTTIFIALVRSGQRAGRNGDVKNLGVIDWIIPIRDGSVAAGAPDIPLDILHTLGDKAPFFECWCGRAVLHPRATSYSEDSWDNARFKSLPPALSEHAR